MNNTFQETLPAQADANALTRLAIDMKNGSRRATEKLYEEMSPKAYGFFLARSGHSREVAEDLSQDIFVRLIKNVQTFDETKGRFVIWFWQIARNMLIDHYRAKKAIPFSAYAEKDIEAMFVVSPGDLGDRLKYLEMMKFLKGMEADDRELFKLRYVKDMAYKEIGALTGRSEGALRVASLRIKKKIRKSGLEERWRAG